MMAKLRKPKRKSTDAEYYAYMEKLAKAKAKEWKRPEDDTLTEMLNDNTYCNCCRNCTYSTG